MEKESRISNEIVKHYIQYSHDEYGQIMSADRALAEINHLREIGCNLYEDCRGCCKFKNKCPICVY